MWLVFSGEVHAVMHACTLHILYSQHSLNKFYASINFVWENWRNYGHSPNSPTFPSAKVSLYMVSNLV